VHMIAPFGGVRFQNRLQALPKQGGSLVAFVTSRRVQYVVARKNSYYDKQARSAPSVFRPLGGRRVRTYRVQR